MYEVLRREQHETITFRVNTGSSGSFANNKPHTHKFRFQKIFDGHATQSEVFNAIAKPVVNSVLNGFNGTIFAYGQTGSGKTYAITGSSEHYEDRGIIPRSIEEVFDYINKTPEKYTIYISYLEIYNEIGYDLLNPKQHISCLEELPYKRQNFLHRLKRMVQKVMRKHGVMKRLMDVAKYRVKRDYFQILPSKSRKVVLLEDSKGESHLRNLSVQKVSTEQEAMKLLFLGDTNRIIAETPMNVCSSRSHCIFTICVTSKNNKSGKIRRSKLNLVDLAGSERIYKSNITGTTLSEAKYINLSLHYLEQVVLALSQRRSHVPFRNSMLTYMLRDSLSGNCVTVLLATLAVNKKNICETIATCKFAQRVAEVNLEAVINEEIDPQQEIEYLKREIESLRQQLLQHSKFKMPMLSMLNRVHKIKQSSAHRRSEERFCRMWGKDLLTLLWISGKLSKEEKEKWKKVIANYLTDAKDELPLANFDMRHVQYCFKLLKEAVKDNDSQKLKLICAKDSSKEIIEQYKKTIEEKEEEISTLKSLLFCGEKTQDGSNAKVSSAKTYSLEDLQKENIPPEFTDSLNLSPAQRVAFEIFMQDPKNRPELDYYKNAIHEIYEIAGTLTTVIERCQARILNIKAKNRTCTDRIMSAEMDLEMMNQQSIYKNSLMKLQELKKETDHFKKGMEQAKLNILENFKQWYEEIGRKEYNNKSETRHPASPRNVGNTFNEFANEEFETLWKQSGDSQFLEDTYSLLSKNRTPCSPCECTPLVVSATADNVSESSLYSRLDKYATEKVHSCFARSRPRSPVKFASDILKTKSSCFNHFDTTPDLGCLPEDYINSALAMGNLRTLAPNSCFNSKEERRRSRSKSPRKKHDCNFSWVPEYSDSFNSKYKDRSRSRSPHKFYTFDSFFDEDKTGSHQSKGRNHSSSFSVVYQEIMGSNDYIHDDKYLVPERPYSSPSDREEEQFNMRSRMNKYRSYPYEQELKGNLEHNISTDTVSRILEEKSTNNSFSQSSTNIPQVWNFNKENNFASKNPIFSNKIGVGINYFTNRGDNNKFGFVTNNSVNSEETLPDLKCLRIDSSRSNNTALNKCESLLLPEDTKEFRKFVKTIPFTGDAEVDEEIIKFYRTKFVCAKNS